MLEEDLEFRFSCLCLPSSGVTGCATTMASFYAISEVELGLSACWVSTYQLSFIPSSTNLKTTTKISQQMSGGQQHESFIWVLLS